MKKVVVLFIFLSCYFIVNAQQEWSGNWDTDYGKMKITVTGQKTAKGKYEFKNGELKGECYPAKNEFIFSGTWTQANRFGWFIFKMPRNNKNKFYGEWGYGNAGSAKEGSWNGTRQP